MAIPTTTATTLSVRGLEAHAGEVPTLWMADTASDEQMAFEALAAISRRLGSALRAALVLSYPEF